MATTAPTVSPLDDIDQPRSESQWELVLKRFLRHRMAVISLVVLVLLLLGAILVPIFVPLDELVVDNTVRFLPPFSTNPNTGQFHLFGTDNFGRDYLVRLFYAARISLTVAIVVSLSASLIGMLLGLIAGYFGTWVDVLVSRSLEFVATFPLLVILLVLSSILLENEDLLPLPDMLISFVSWFMLIPEREVQKVVLLIIALTLLTWPQTARLTRGMVMSARQQPYIESAHALGASHTRTIFKHIVPNVLPPLIVDFTLLLNTMLVLESSLSFLGFGITDPPPTWGNMLRVANSNMFSYPWLPIIPALPILICSLAINYIGDGMRDALDPYMKL